MKKRGQVTLFIIIAIVLVIVVFSAIMFREQISRGFARIFQPEAEPIRLYIEECVESTGTAGIELMAQQGGYIQIPERLATSFDGFLPRSSVTFGPIVGLQIPMWWYKGYSYIPEINDMEDSLSQFMEENLPLCFAGFSSFPELNVAERGNLSVQASINDNNVVYDIDYPLTISSKAGEEDSVIEIESFTKTIDRNLGEMHDLAVDIMEFENENAFIENITMDLIAVADGAEDSPYFPMEGFEIRCPGRTWSEQFDLIPDLQNMVKYNMNYVNFKGTYHIDSGYDYFEKQYSFDVSDKNYPRIQPKIVYDKSYGMELDVDPSSGDTVRGIPIQFPLLGQCIYVFHHRYTIEFPVRVQLTDIDSGFTFNFATPIVIENSLPKRYESEFFRSFEYTPSDEDFCANRIYPRTVFIQDAITGDKLSDVDVRYECVRFACDLGKTKQPTFDGIPIYGSVPSLDTAFPPCLNGFLIAEKEGYIGNISQYTVSEAGGTPPPISLTPLKKLFMNVVVVELEDGLGIRPLAKDEIAVIFVYDEKHNYEDAFYYPPTKFVKDRLELIYDDAEYELDIKLVKNNTVIGGYYLPEWSLRRSELSTSSEVVFTVFTKPRPPKTNDEFAGFWNNDVLKNSKDFLPAVR